MAVIKLEQHVCYAKIKKKSSIEECSQACHAISRFVRIHAYAHHCQYTCIQPLCQDTWIRQMIRTDM